MKYFRKTQSEYGSYVDAEGVRYTVEWCSCIYSPDNLTPKQMGYEQHKNQEAALEVWGLTVYVDPEQEKLLINDFTEND